MLPGWVPNISLPSSLLWALCKGSAWLSMVAATTWFSPDKHQPGTAGLWHYRLASWLEAVISGLLEGNGVTGDEAIPAVQVGEVEKWFSSREGMGKGKHEYNMRKGRAARLQSLYLVFICSLYASVTEGIAL